MLPLYYTDAFLAHDTGPEHVERPQRLTAVRALLRQQPFAARVDERAPAAAPEDAVAAVHSPFLIDRVRRNCERSEPLDADTAVGPASWPAALLAAGAVLQAARESAGLRERRAFCLVRPPGHHAAPGRAMGFCLLNSVAIAARDVVGSRLARRVLIFDHDAHHGNGTQDAFYDSPDVLYMSIHQSPLYPGTGGSDEIGKGEGEGFTVNAPVKPGTGVGAYRALLEELLVPIAEEFSPDLVLVSAGFDSHHRDPLGSLGLTSDFYPEMIRGLAEIEGKVVIALEGGYDLEAVARSAVGEIGALLNEPAPAWGERARDEVDPRPLVATLRRALRRHWDV